MTCRPLALLVLLVAGPLAAESMTPQAFEAFSEGRTLHFTLNGAPFGAEQYFDGRRSVWRFVDGCPKQNAWRSMAEVPARTPESDAMSKDLEKHGFRFVGSVICYAYMQATGMVNDHTVDCFRWSQLHPTGSP